jgi:hypothetical protein
LQSVYVHYIPCDNAQCTNKTLCVQSDVPLLAKGFVPGHPRYSPNT